MIRTFGARVGLPALMLGTAILVVAVLIIVSFEQTSRVREMELKGEAVAADAGRLIAGGQALMQAVNDAELGQTGFLLSGETDFVVRAIQARHRTEEVLENLAQLSAARPAYAAVVRDVRRLAAERLRLVERSIAFAEAGERGEALTALAEGGRVMADLRAKTFALMARAQADQDRSRLERNRFQQQAAGLQFVLGAATLIALLLALSSLASERLAASRSARVQWQMNESLQAAKQRAEDADMAKSRFLAAASHDMRQPLQALALYISTLERRVESEQAREILGNMDGAVRSMSRLFTALLDLARLEAGILKPEPLVFDLGDLLREVAEQSSDPWGKTQIRVIPTAVRARSDPDLLEIAIRNLVSNAVKHSKGGHVLLGCRRDGSEVRIEVHDDGQGIPSEQLDRLFAEFVRGEQAGSTEGVGLGLSIVERMVKLLGHRLFVKSEIGRGSVFGVVVPRAQSAAERTSETPEAANLHGLRVLLADDEPLALDAMRRTLEDAGALVTTAEDAEGVRGTSAQNFDLYVFDLNLGCDNGPELLRELENQRGIPVNALIVTGGTTPAVLAELRAANRSWLTKPVTPAALAAAVVSVLPHWTARREPLASST